MPIGQNRREIWESKQCKQTAWMCVAPPNLCLFFYLNAPYDLEVGQTNNQRLELVFLEHTYRWLKPGGVLEFLIPQPQLKPCARVLSEHFTELSVFRLTEPRCVLYCFLVVFAYGSRVGRIRVVVCCCLLRHTLWHRPNYLPMLAGDSNARLLVEELIDSSSVLVFGQRLRSGRRARSKSSVPQQASLFG